MLLAFIAAHHGFDRLHHFARRLGLAQEYDHAAAHTIDLLHHVLQRPAATGGAAERIMQRVLHMHAHRHRFIGIQLALDQREVQFLIDRIFVGNQLEVAKIGRKRCFDDALQRFFILDAIADQILDGADLEVMLAGESLQIAAPRHAAIFIQNLDDHRRRFESGQTRQIAAGFGVACARQYAARARHQREDMPRLHQILRLCIRLHCGLHGNRAVRRRDAGGDAFGRFDGDGEIGFQRGGVVAHHQRQAQLLAALLRQRQANQPAPVARHEIDVFRLDRFGRHQQVAFVFAIFIVHDDDHLAGLDVFDNFFGRI